MAVPTPPTAGEPIAEAWGDVVHAGVVAMDIQAGSVSLPFPNNAVSTSTPVTFPRPFASPPVVVATMGGPTTSGVNTSVGVATVTATNFALHAREVRESAINGSVQCNWIAYGPRA